MRRAVVNLVALTAVWVILWRDLSWANVASGVVLAGVILAVFPFTTHRVAKTVRPIPFLRYLVVFAWSVVKANLYIAWEVVTPNNRINEGVVAVTLQTDDPVLITIINHTINLAPGTMVIDVQRDPTVMYVHALHLGSVDRVRADVLRLERLVMDAFDPARATAGGTR